MDRLFILDFIYQRLKKEEVDLKDYEKVPINFDRNTTLEEIKKRLSQNYWERNLDNLYSIVIRCKNLVDGQEIHISQDDEELKNVFGKGNVGRAIEKCRKIGLLSIYNSSYYPGKYSKSYVVNGYVRDILLGYYIQRNYDVSTNQEAAITYCSWMIPDKYKKGLDIKRGINLIPIFSEDITRGWIIEKHKIIQELRKNNEYENTKYLYHWPERIRRSVPKITLTKKNDKDPTQARKIYKIGLRDTSAASNLRSNFSSEEEKNSYNGPTKKKYLDNCFPQGWWEYDVRSSIWRVTRWINTGIWEDDSLDMYELVNGGKFSSKEERDNFKLLSMSLYFDTSSIPVMFTHINDRASNRIKKSDEVPDGITEKEFIEAMTPFLENIKNQIGTTYDSKIFVIESYIYSILACTLLDEGFELVQIYDGFYVGSVPGETEEDFRNHCKELLQKITSDIWNNGFSIISDFIS